MGRENLSLVLWTTQDLGTPDSPDRFIRVLRGVGDHWLPQRFGPYEPLRYKRASDDWSDFRSLWHSPSHPEHPNVYLLWATTKTLSGRGHVYWARGWSHDFNTLGVTIPLGTYARIHDEFWRLSLTLFEEFGVAYGTMHSDGEFWAQHHNPRPGGSTILGSRPGSHLPGVYFGNLFGPPVVEFFGEDRLVSCPAVRNERLLGGGWLMKTTEDPAAWNTDAARGLKQAVRAHLGERAFFDIRAPDRPTIHPFWDFSTIRVGPRIEIESVFGEPVTLELVETPEAAKRFLNEVLVRTTQLAGRVKDARLDFSPGSLGTLDKSIKRRIRGQRKRRELVLQLTAYFGEVVRRNLGGSWELDESSGTPVVRLTDGRVEYPVVRALKFIDDGDRLSDWYDFVAKGGERLLT